MQETKMFRFLTPKRLKLKTIDEVRAEVKARHDRIGLEVATELTRGNTSISRRDFLTEDDIADRKRKLE